jgi:hypothetical protein
MAEGRIDEAVDELVGAALGVAGRHHGPGEVHHCRHHADSGSASHA